jgi:hypothetical protein
MRPYQSDFVAGDSRIVSIVGAKGSSKTWCGARFVISEMQRQPGSQGLLMWNTLQQARDIYYQDIEPLLKSLQIPHRFNQQTLTLQAMGSIVHLRSAEADVIRRIESVAYHWGWADEASYYTPEALRTFASRIRKGEARIRVTSMPDEPDAFIYKFIEDQQGTLYEIGLRDNPDKNFRERYEAILRSTYSGSALDRFLYGKRVSLTGVGLFSITPDHCDSLHYDEGSDLYLSWDFNVEYRAVSAWQIISRDDKARPIFGCIASYQMKQATVYEDAVWLCDKYKNHKGSVILVGDASGANRTALTTDSMWSAVREVMYKQFGGQLRNKVPLSNPSVKDTIQCVNWALREHLIRFDKAERNVYLSLQAAKADKYGDLDKSSDYKEAGIRTHDADTARYAIWEVYSKLYPGNRNRFYIA